MASVTIRVFKSYGSPANRQWSNVYEVNDGGPVVEAVDPTTFVAAAEAIVAAERVLHFDAVYFNRYTISSWQPETGGYDPADLVTSPLGLQGQVTVATAGGEALLEDLRVVLWLARKAATGRPGKAFYRGCLAEAWVQNQGGKWKVEGTSLATLVANYKTALGGLVGGTPTGNRLVLIGGTLDKSVVATTQGGLAHTRIKRTYTSPYHIRNVTDMVLQGVTVRQTASAYFDRP
jgi:hypothetical protein